MQAQVKEAERAIMKGLQCTMWLPMFNENYIYFLAFKFEGTLVTPPNDAIPATSERDGAAKMKLTFFLMLGIDQQSMQLSTSPP